ncbi:MAG: class I SAM-dependent methyltransferase [Bacteroidota bacterium]|nr:class I SAM-dependent methyltransferase [Bacteroidota bacterium]
MGLYSLLTNNIIINNILIVTGLDAKKELAVGQWKAFKYDENKSIQQNAGFSHSPEVEESLSKVKTKLIEQLKLHVPVKGNVLDFGCGPGIYMKMLANDYTVFGVDVSEGMLQSAHKLLPANKFYLGNFLSISFEEKYQAIYSISVLEYIPVSKIDTFFKKCAEVISNKGLLFIQYPHALNSMDLLYPDRNYINYSPEFITKIASRYFTIVENKQSYDGRETCKFDKEPYPTGSKSFKNGYLLIAIKK